MHTVTKRKERIDPGDYSLYVLNYRYNHMLHYTNTNGYIALLAFCVTDFLRCKQSNGL